jgi:hypothetical protein
MGATQADLSLGVDPEIAGPALRRPLAGEARHLHHKQVTRARVAQTANPTPHNHPSHARQKDVTPFFPEIFEFQK